VKSWRFCQKFYENKGEGVMKAVGRGGEALLSVPASLAEGPARLSRASQVLFFFEAGSG
jgi:hypothetical protein